MIKRSFYLFLIFGFVLVGVAHSAEMAPEGTWERKLQRGFLNIVLSPMEFTVNLNSQGKKDRFGLNWITGIVKGSGKALTRAFVGVYELATAPFAGSANYAPILSPEFAWEKLPASKN